MQLHESEIPMSATNAIESASPVQAYRDEVLAQARTITTGRYMAGSILNEAHADDNVSKAERAWLINQVIPHLGRTEVSKMRSLARAVDFATVERFAITVPFNVMVSALCLKGKARFSPEQSIAVLEAAAAYNQSETFGRIDHQAGEKKDGTTNVKVKVPASALVQSAESMFSESEAVSPETAGRILAGFKEVVAERAEMLASSNETKVEVPAEGEKLEPAVTSGQPVITEKPDPDYVAFQKARNFLADLFSEETVPTDSLKFQIWLEEFSDTITVVS